MNNVEFTHEVKQVLEKSGIKYKQFVVEVQQWGERNKPTGPTKFHIHVYGPEIGIHTQVGPEQAIQELQERVDQIMSNTEPSIVLTTDQNT